MNLDNLITLIMKPLPIIALLALRHYSC